MYASSDLPQHNLHCTHPGLPFAHLRARLCTPLCRLSTPLRPAVAHRARARSSCNQLLLSRAVLLPQWCAHPQVVDAKEAIATISTEATQEAGLEAMLDKVNDKWRHVEFTVNSYKVCGPTLHLSPPCLCYDGRWHGHDRYHLLVWFPAWQPSSDAVDVAGRWVGPCRDMPSMLAWVVGGGGG